MFSLFLYVNYVYFKNHVVVNLLRLLKHRSKHFCDFDSFSREKELPSLFFRRCLSLLLGREGSVFLDACVRGLV